MNSSFERHRGRGGTIETKLPDRDYKDKYSEELSHGQVAEQEIKELIREIGELKEKIGDVKIERALQMAEVLKREREIDGLKNDRSKLLLEKNRLMKMIEKGGGTVPGEDEEE